MKIVLPKISPNKKYEYNLNMSYQRLLKIWFKWNKKKHMFLKSKHLVTH